MIFMRLVSFTRLLLSNKLINDLLMTRFNSVVEVEHWLSFLDTGTSCESTAFIVKNLQNYELSHKNP